MEPRRRAPQRPGRRTTLRVPDAVMEAAQTLARELGTTPNDVIIRFAEEGIAARERRHRIEQLARERRDAVAAVPGAKRLRSADPEELRAAMLSGRREP